MVVEIIAFINVTAAVLLICLLLPKLFSRAQIPTDSARDKFSSLTAGYGDRMRIRLFLRSLLWLVLYAFCAAWLTFLLMLAFTMAWFSDSFPPIEVTAPWIASLFGISLVLALIPVLIRWIRRRKPMQSEESAFEGEFVRIPRGGIGEPNAFPVFCRRYAYSGDGVGQMLSLRFYNDGKHTVTKIRYCVRVRDAEGRLIFSRRAHARVCGAPQTEFGASSLSVPQRGEVEVQIESVQSGNYEYFPTPHGYRVRYLDEKRNKDKSKPQEDGFSQKSYGGFAILIPFLLFTVAFTILMIGYILR